MSSEPLPPSLDSSASVALARADSGPQAASLEQLTCAQDASLARIRDKWIAIGLSTDPADWPRAEAAVRLAYRQAGLSDSIRMIWAGSPMGGAAIAESLMRRASGLRLAADVTGPALDAVTRRARHHVPRSVWARFSTEVAYPVAAQVVWQVWEPVNDELTRNVKHLIPVPGYGQHDAPRLAFFDALRETGFGVSALEPLMEVAQSCGWWWSFDDVCLLSERPLRLPRDECGRLASSIRPVIVYPDGWSVFGRESPERSL